ncbi:hypothetical protein UFOVP765_55 [uncultured Caudovirales phage]|uniref:Uncharacterized protein n=1 Tax=uncultured Caudovirales phage TaxID=2100421 RepID=A0A6J5NU15_9CAUD|nr:hypothetical protein UFOVP765_55 [uncultured Caudovirales phage]
MENPTSDQIDILDKLIGRKIWDIEIIEEEPLAILRIFLSETEDDYIEINAEYMQMLYISPKPNKLH